MKTEDDLGSDGSPVTVYAWPRDATLEDLPVGSSVSLKPIASTTTDGSGDFSIDPTASTLAPYDNPDGSVNIEVAAIADDGTLAHESATLDAPDSGNSAATTSLDVDLTGSGDPVADPSADMSTVLSKAGAQLAKKISDVGPRTAIVGVVNIGSGATGACAQWQYTTESSSTFGVATSASGSYGTWKAAGTAAVSRSSSSSASQTFPKYCGPTNLVMQTYVHVAKFQVQDAVCSLFSCMYGPKYYEDRATGFDGGTIVNPASSLTSAKYCVPELGGSVFSKSKTDAVTWTNGLSMGSVIGIDLSSQTGYSTASHEDFTFSAKRRLCGTGDYPASNAYTLYVLS